MRDEETNLDPDLEWGEGMSGRVDGPVWTQPAGLGGRALAAGRDQSFLSFFLRWIWNPPKKGWADQPTAHRPIDWFGPFSNTNTSTFDEPSFQKI